MDLSHRPARRGRAGRRHHRRPVDRRAGHAAHDADVPHRRRRPPAAWRRTTSRRSATGSVKYGGINVVVNDAGQHDRAHAQRRDPHPRRQGPRAREVRRPRRRRCCKVEDGQTGQAAARCSASGTRTTSRSSPRSAASSATRTSSRARRCGSRATRRATPAGRSSSTRATCTRRSSSRTTTGKILDFHYLPERARIEVEDGQKITAGTLLAKTPREVGGTQDITGGLPRVTEIFEARKPKEPAVIAEIDGARRAARREAAAASGRSSSRTRAGIEREHLVPHGKHLRVHARRPRPGRRRRSSTGRSSRTTSCASRARRPCSSYLLREVQNVYRSQGVEIDDKHIEIIVAQMLRKVQVETSATPTSCPGAVVDKFEFRGRNDELMAVRQDRGPGRHRLPGGRHRPQRRTSTQENHRVEAAGGKQGREDPRPSRPRRARCSWASPRRPCRARASSRRPASRRRPRS